MHFALGAMASAVVLSAASVAAGQTVTSQDNLWAGPYVGLNMGGSWGNTSLRASAVPGGGPVVIPPGDVQQIVGAPSKSSGAGFAVGGELGYNWQFDHDWVLGVETDGGWFDVGQSRSLTLQSTQPINPPPHFTIGQSVKTDWVWTLRPRLGYAWGPWLGYITGGLAVADPRISAAYADTQGRFASFSFSELRAGGTVGLGGAWMFMPGWSTKIEWLYSDFGTVRRSIPVGNGFAVFTSQGNVRTNVVRAGLDYKF